jgi:HTH-type transcriptional regulator / antitoxin HigA
MIIPHQQMDNFWFTVMHEYSHMRHGDAFSLDLDIEGDDIDRDTQLPVDLCEQRANVEAAAFLIPRSELEGFIGRVSPLYSKERIIQFAHRIKIHPAIIVGQLQHYDELHPSVALDMLSKIRDIITETAVTDGWGRYLAVTY